MKAVLVFPETMVSLAMKVEVMVKLKTVAVAFATIVKFDTVGVVKLEIVPVALEAAVTFVAVGVEIGFVVVSELGVAIVVGEDVGKNDA